MFSTHSKTLCIRNTDITTLLAGLTGRLLNGSSPPLMNQGSDDDFYIQDGNILFGPKKNGVWPMPGIPLGGTLLRGTIAPTPVVGNINDLFIVYTPTPDTAVAIYGPKTTNGWGNPLEFNAPAFANHMLYVSQGPWSPSAGEVNFQFTDVTSAVAQATALITASPELRVVITINTGSYPEIVEVPAGIFLNGIGDVKLDGVELMVGPGARLEYNFDNIKTFFFTTALPAGAVVKYTSCYINGAITSATTTASHEFRNCVFSLTPSIPLNLSKGDATFTNCSLTGIADDETIFIGTDINDLPGKVLFSGCEILDIGIIIYKLSTPVIVTECSFNNSKISDGTANTVKMLMHMRGCIGDGLEINTLAQLTLEGCSFDSIVHPTTLVVNADAARLNEIFYVKITNCSIVGNVTFSNVGSFSITDSTIGDKRPFYTFTLTNSAGGQVQDSSLPNVIVDSTLSGNNTVVDTSIANMTSTGTSNPNLTLIGSNIADKITYTNALIFLINSFSQRIVVSDISEIQILNCTTNTISISNFDRCLIDATIVSKTCNITDSIVGSVMTISSSEIEDLTVTQTNATQYPLNCLNSVFAIFRINGNFTGDVKLTDVSVTNFFTVAESVSNSFGFTNSNLLTYNGNLRSELNAKNTTFGIINQFGASATYTDCIIKRVNVRAIHTGPMVYIGCTINLYVPAADALNLSMVSCTLTSGLETNAVNVQCNLTNSVFRDFGVYGENSIINMKACTFSNLILGQGTGVHEIIDCNFENITCISTRGNLFNCTAAQLLSIIDTAGVKSNLFFSNCTSSVFKSSGEQDANIIVLGGVHEYFDLNLNQEFKASGVTCTSLVLSGTGPFYFVDSSISTVSDTLVGVELFARGCQIGLLNLINGPALLGMGSCTVDGDITVTGLTPIIPINLEGCMFKDLIASNTNPTLSSCTCINITHTGLGNSKFVGVDVSDLITLGNDKDKAAQHVIYNSRANQVNVVGGKLLTSCLFSESITMHYGSISGSNISVGTKLLLSDTVPAGDHSITSSTINELDIETLKVLRINAMDSVIQAFSGSGITATTRLIEMDRRSVSGSAIIKNTLTETNVNLETSLGDLFPLTSILGAFITATANDLLGTPVSAKIVNNTTITLKTQLAVTQDTIVSFVIHRNRGI
jgi:hypothetical protein